MPRTWSTAALAALTLYAGAAGADTEQDYHVDTVGQVDARWIAELDGKAGPVAFRQALLQNLPPASEIQEATPKDVARPQVLVVLDNLGSSRAKLVFQVQLEDEGGQVLLRCNVSKPEGTGHGGIVRQVCGPRDTMRTLDVPKVRAVRIVGTVSVRG